MDKKVLYTAALKAGLILGGVSILVSILEYILGIMPVGFKATLIMVVGMAISITVLVFLLKNFRNSVGGGFISFLDAFLFCLIAFVVAALLSGIYTYLFISFFDPGYMKQVLEANRTWLENYLDGKVTEEQLQLQLDKMDAKMESMTPLKQFGSNLLAGIIGGAVIGLILAAIMKKNADVFDTKSDVV